MRKLSYRSTPARTSGRAGGISEDELGADAALLSHYRWSELLEPLYLIPAYPIFNKIYP